MGSSRVCAIPDCGRETYRAQIWCTKHYVRNHKYGDPLGFKPRVYPPKRVCSVEGCDGPHDTLSYCRPHAYRFKRYGDPLHPGYQTRLCDVEGCGRKHYGKGLCQMHWHRVDGTGEVGPAEPIRPPYEATCKFDGCERRHTSLGYCNTHYRRLLKIRRGTTEHVVITDATWLRSGVSYQTVHKRLKKERGPARNHPCAHCGSGAAHWGYDYTDENELIGSNGCPYSVEIQRYIPLCIYCHRRFDSVQRYVLSTGRGTSDGYALELRDRLDERIRAMEEALAASPATATVASLLGMMSSAEKRRLAAEFLVAVSHVPEWIADENWLSGRKADEQEKAARKAERRKIRDWAARNGLPVGANGRIPQWITDAYRRAASDEEDAAA